MIRTIEFVIRNAIISLYLLRDSEERGTLKIYCKPEHFRKNTSESPCGRYVVLNGYLAGAYIGATSAARCQTGAWMTDVRSKLAVPRRGRPRRPVDASSPYRRPQAFLSSFTSYQIGSSSRSLVFLAGY